MRKADNLPPSCAVVTKSGSLNFLEPSGPVQACNGTDLPFFFKWTNLPPAIRVAHIWEKRNSSRILDVKRLDRERERERESVLFVMPHSGPTDHLIP